MEEIGLRLTSLSTSDKKSLPAPALPAFPLHPIALVVTGHPKPWAAAASRGVWGLRAKPVFGPLCKATNRPSPDCLTYGVCRASKSRSAAAAITSGTSSRRKCPASVSITGAFGNISVITGKPLARIGSLIPHTISADTSSPAAHRQHPRAAPAKNHIDIKIARPPFAFYRAHSNFYHHLIHLSTATRSRLFHKARCLSATGGVA